MNIIRVLANMLKEIDTTRIRGIGVALKLKPAQSVPSKGTTGTLEEFFAGTVSTSNRPESSIGVKRPLEKEDVVMESDLVTSACIVCGLRILPGHLSKHFATHLGAEEVCPCPICFEPIELTDAAHVSSHFILPLA